MAKKKVEIDKKEHSYFYSLEVEGINCFKDKQALEFSHGKDNFSKWTIILGDNGTGKTTLLKILDRLQPIKEEFHIEGNTKIIPLLPYEKVINNSKLFKQKLKINLKILNNKKIYNLKIYSEKENTFSVYNKNISNLFLLSYGASRRMSKNQNISHKKYEYSNITSLFDESIELINAEEWFLQKYLKSLVANSDSKSKYKKEFEQVKNLLKEILPDINEIRIKPINDENSKILLEVQTNYGWVNLRDLSFGYQTVAALLVDISSKMMEQYPESKNPLAEPVIILIDEIDLHLHPKWQRVVIDKLSKYFLNAQFIVTAHSPLIVQAAEDIDANIVVCRNEGDRVVIDNNPESVKGWRIDQILTSDLFGVGSAQSVEFENLRNEKINILLNKTLSKNDRERLKKIDEELNRSPIFSNKDSIDAEELIKKAAELLKK